MFGPFTYDITTLTQAVSESISTILSNTSSIIKTTVRRFNHSRTPTVTLPTSIIGSIPVITVNIPEPTLDLQESTTQPSSTQLSDAYDQITQLLNERVASIDQQRHKDARIAELEGLLAIQAEENDAQENEVVQQRAANRALNSRVDKLEKQYLEIVEAYQNTQTELDDYSEENASLQSMALMLEKKRDYLLQALKRRRGYFLATHQAAELEFFEARNILASRVTEVESELEVQQAINASFESQEGLAEATRKAVECAQYVRLADERNDLQDITIKDLKTELASTQEKLALNQPMVEALNALLSLLDQKVDLETAITFFNDCVQPQIQLGVQNLQREQELTEAAARLEKECDIKMTEALQLEEYSDGRVPPMQLMLECQSFVLEKFILESGSGSEVVNREKAKQWYQEFEQKAKDEAALRNLVPTEADALAVPAPDTSNESLHAFFNYLADLDAEALRVANEVNLARNNPDQMQYVEEENLQEEYLGDPSEEFEQLDRGAFTQAGDGIIDQHVQNVLRASQHPLRAGSSSNSQSSAGSSPVPLLSSKAAGKQRMEENLQLDQSEVPSFDPTSLNRPPPPPGLGFSSKQTNDMFRMNLGGPKR